MLGGRAYPQLFPCHLCLIRVGIRADGIKRNALQDENGFVLEIVVPAIRPEQRESVAFTFDALPVLRRMPIGCRAEPQQHHRCSQQRRAPSPFRFPMHPIPPQS